MTAQSMANLILFFHNEEIIRPLKKVDAAAMAWAMTPEQVVEILKYIIGEE